MSMADLMLDLETLGTAPGSVITQIGACYFDRETGEIGEKILINVQIDDCIKHGLVTDGGSIKFWLDQATKHEPTFLKEPVTLTVAIATLRNFYKTRRNDGSEFAPNMADRDASCWSHATFDFPMLAYACRVIGEGPCLPYRNLRDIRTLIDLSKLPYKKDVAGDPKTHDALDDCRFQVRYCTEAFNAIKAIQEGK